MAPVVLGDTVASALVDALPPDPERVQARKEDVNRSRGGDDLSMAACEATPRVAAKELGCAVDSECACRGDTPGCQGPRAVAEQSAVLKAADELSVAGDIIVTPASCPLWRVVLSLGPIDRLLSA